ncbi:MAG TPA: gamma carbonic anhydrase family protein [bacterium]|nr:gamma carbonic anhydrase family protein [bacterium]
MNKFGPGVYLHPAAVVIGDVEVGEYSSLWPCAVARADFERIRIGRFSSIQDCCVLHAAPGAPVEVGDFVTVGHGAMLHGCTVEDSCIVSLNAVIMDRAVIGKGSIVAAGAVVRENTRVPPGSLVVGVPGRIKSGRPGQEEQNRMSAVSYCALAQAYLSGKDRIEADELMRKMARINKAAGA